jgi:methyl-accepting chemotaxis protein
MDSLERAATQVRAAADELYAAMQRTHESSDMTAKGAAAPARRLAEMALAAGQMSAILEQMPRAFWLG